MERIQPFLYFVGGLLLMFLLNKCFFAAPEIVPAVTDAVTSSEAAVASSSSSLNLIVRVSPLLQKEKQVSSLKSATPASTVPYDFYTSAESVRGKQAVLFFVSADDPFSLDHHAFITDLFHAGLLKVPVYRVDFETATGTRLAFGVIVSDTFVLLDATGRSVQSILHPSETELRALLTTSR